jgi:hypothetical protein
VVQEVTNDKKLEKSERKRLQVEHAHKKSTRAKILKLADKTSNLRALAASPPPWSVQRSARDKSASFKFARVRSADRSTARMSPIDWFFISAPRSALIKTAPNKLAPRTKRRANVGRYGSMRLRG